MYDRYNELKENVSEILMREYGITYEEYEKMDIDEVSEMIAKKKKKRKKEKYVTVMIGSGEHSTFKKVKRGELFQLADGTFVRAGITPEESREQLDRELDEIIFGKPKAFVKRLVRKIKK